MNNVEIIVQRSNKTKIITVNVMIGLKQVLIKNVDSYTKGIEHAREHIPAIREQLRPAKIYGYIY